MTLMSPLIPHSFIPMPSPSANPTLILPSKYPQNSTLYHEPHCHLSGPIHDLSSGLLELPLSAAPNYSSVHTAAYSQHRGQNSPVKIKVRSHHCPAQYTAQLSTLQWFPIHSEWQSPAEIYKISHDLWTTLHLHLLLPFPASLTLLQPYGPSCCSLNAAA